jgi:hypothetical protein
VPSTEGSATALSSGGDPSSQKVLERPAGVQPGGSPAGLQVRGGGPKVWSEIDPWSTTAGDSYATLVVMLFISTSLSW